MIKMERRIDFGRASKATKGSDGPFVDAKIRQPLPGLVQD